MQIAGTTERVGDRDVTILVEVDGDEPAGATAADWGGESRADRMDRVIDTARDVFGDGLALARDCAVRAAHTFDDSMAQHRPDAVELQIALRLDAEAGAVITKVGAGAQLQVKLKWNHPRTG